jgi:hypothetical protein
MGHPVKKGDRMSDNDVSPITWRALTEEEEAEYREYARCNYVAGTNVNILWHPVYLHECYRINVEAGVVKHG